MTIEYFYANVSFVPRLSFSNFFSRVGKISSQRAHTAENENVKKLSWVFHNFPQTPSTLTPSRNFQMKLCENGEWIERVETLLIYAYVSFIFHRTYDSTFFLQIRLVDACLNTENSFNFNYEIFTLFFGPPSMLNVWCKISRCCRQQLRMATEIIEKFYRKANEARRNVWIGFSVSSSSVFTTF